MKKIAVFNVTARCDSACGFCFGPETIIDNQKLITNAEKSTVVLKKIIKKLYKNGTRVLVFTGGEPLLRQDIWELIEFAKRLGMFTALHTNGLLLSRKFKMQKSKCKMTIQNSKLLREKIKFLDQINLPLDGYDEKTNDAMRGKGHLRAVMGVLRGLKGLPIRVIISTVATAQNAKNVPKIGKILPKWIYKWRVFQFKAQGKARQVRREFELTDREFKKIKQKILRLKPEFHIQCVSAKDKEFWRSYKIT